MVWYQSQENQSHFSLGGLVRGNGECEMESHSISPSFLCLDKYYNNKNEIKSNSGGNKLLLLSRILIHHT